MTSKDGSTSVVTKQTTTTTNYEGRSPRNKSSLYHVLAKAGRIDDSSSGMQSGQKLSWKEFQDALNKGQTGSKEENSAKESAIRRRIVDKQRSEELYKAELENRKARRENKNLGGLARIAGSQRAVPNSWQYLYDNRHRLAEQETQDSQTDPKQPGTISNNNKRTDNKESEVSKSSQVQFVEPSRKTATSPEKNKKGSLVNGTEDKPKPSEKPEFVIGPPPKRVEKSYSKTLQKSEIKESDIKDNSTTRTTVVKESTPRWEYVSSSRKAEDIPPRDEQGTVTKTVAKEYRSQTQQDDRAVIPPVSATLTTQSRSDYVSQRKYSEKQSKEQDKPEETVRLGSRQSHRYIPTPPSSRQFSRGSRRSQNPPRLAYNAKDYDDYEDEFYYTRKTSRHQGASISPETIDRLSQPSRRVLQDQYWREQIETPKRKHKPPTRSRSLGDLSQINQPRLAYSKLENYTDYEAQEQEYYRRKNQERRPINQETIERLSKPSERYLNYRRLEDLYQRQLHAASGSSTTPRDRSRRHSLGDLRQPGHDSYLREKTLDDWEQYYRHTRDREPVYDPPNSALERLSRPTRRNVDWKWQEEYYKNKIEHARQKQREEKELRKSLDRFKDIRPEPPTRRSTSPNLRSRSASPYDRYSRRSRSASPYERPSQTPSTLRKPLFPKITDESLGINRQAIIESSIPKKRSKRKIRFKTPLDTKMANSYYYDDQAPYDDYSRRAINKVKRANTPGKYSHVPSRLLDHFGKKGRKSPTNGYKDPYYGDRKVFKPTSILKNKRSSPVPTTYRKIHRSRVGSAAVQSRIGSAGVRRYTPEYDRPRRKKTATRRGKDVYFDENSIRAPSRGKYDFQSLRRNLDFDDEYDEYGRPYRSRPGSKHYTLKPHNDRDFVDPDFRDIHYGRDGYSPQVGARKLDKPSRTRPKTSKVNKVRKVPSKSKITYREPDYHDYESPRDGRDMKTIVRTDVHDPHYRHKQPQGKSVIHEKHIYHHNDYPDEVHYEEYVESPPVSKKSSRSNQSKSYSSNRTSLPSIHRSKAPQEETSSWTTIEYDDDLDKNGKFRYKRNLNTNSGSRPPREVHTVVRQYNNNNHHDVDSVANSVSTIQLSDSNLRRGSQPQKSEDRPGWEPVLTRAVIHEEPGSVSRDYRSSRYAERAERTSDNTSTDTTLDLDLPRALKKSTSETSSTLAFQADHSKWPTYRFERNGGIACLVRASPKHLDEVKRGLRLVDRIPKELSHRLPPLPFMDFDADETLAISPMQLVWDHPYKKTPNMEEPIYLLMPLNPDTYNDTLQQVIFLYTADLQQWRYAEGKVTRLPVEGKEHDFLEVIIHDPFRYIIFDIKARFIEDIRAVPMEGGELVSTMEPGVRVQMAKRSFDEPARVKLRVEPLDMNELDLSLLIPSINAIHACAVSPIIKISASEPTKRPISVFVPKPGLALFGSQKLGLKCKLSDLRSQRVHLFTKDRQIMRYQLDPALQREFANEYEFHVRIWKAGGSCYAFLVLEGQPPQGADKIKDPFTDVGDSNGFLTPAFLKHLATEIDPDERKIRSLGKQLLNPSSVQEIMRQQQGDSPADLQITALRMLRRWHNQNAKVEDSALVRQLVLSMRETGLAKEALYLQRSYRDYLLAEEGSRFVRIFEELKMCPTVLVHWKALGQTLGLGEEDIRIIERDRRDLRRRCSSMLKRAFERIKDEEEFYRDILLRYIRALEKIGCPRIAGFIERRHLPKFYVNETI